MSHCRFCASPEDLPPDFGDPAIPFLQSLRLAFFNSKAPTDAEIDELCALFWTKTDRWTKFRDSKADNFARYCDRQDMRAFLQRISGAKP